MVEDALTTTPTSKRLTDSVQTFDLVAQCQSTSVCTRSCIKHDLNTTWNNGWLCLGDSTAEIEETT